MHLWSLFWPPYWWLREICPNLSPSFPKSQLSWQPLTVPWPQVLIWYTSIMGWRARKPWSWDLLHWWWDQSTWECWNNNGEVVNHLEQWESILEVSISGWQCPGASKESWYSGEWPEWLSRHYWCVQYHQCCGSNRCRSTLPPSMLFADYIYHTRYYLLS